MPITTLSVTPVSSMALRNWSIPAVSWTKLRKWRWPSTISYFGAGFGSSADAAAIDSSRREPKPRKLRRGCIGVLSDGSCPDASLRVLSRKLFCVPIAEADVDARAFQRLGENLRVLTAIVIRIDHARMEGAHGLGRGLRRHGVRQVHGDEGHVDVLERAHFRRALGVAGEVETLAAVRHDIAIAAALLVIGLPVIRGLQVVNGDGVHFE